ncbi:hypothetical protein FSARC_1647 [Fusarium sarcochroum]|uniref:Chromo domain-containing protein n=1 Tax=Fusarium sarcochroum TaxID=1208366 RepID=A0A8H4XES1_9HYPO|nr:hypothetical protein FSARC_1647 [Fusarium sarcochroum]
MESIQQPEPEPVNPKKRNLPQHGRSRIEVRLKSKPKDYVPGSGPPLQRISLLPPQDSTAYILERIILPSPGVAANGHALPRRMTYIVAWRDLPAAQMLVPAMEILEYVSPRELEEWEFANTEEQLEREKVEPKSKQAGDAPKPKKRGRPPKHSKIETAVVAVPEDDATVMPKKGVMSINTPTKNRLKDFEGLSDEEGSSVQQLQWETTGDSVETDMDQGFGQDGLTSFEEPENARSGEQLDILRDSELTPRAPNQSSFASKQFESFPSTGTSSRQSTPKLTSAKSKSEGKKTKKTSRPVKKSPMLNGLSSGVGQAAEPPSDFTWTPQEESVTYSNSGVETPDPESDFATARLIEEANSVQRGEPTGKSKSKSKSRTSTPKPPKSAPAKPSRRTPPQGEPTVEDTEPAVEDAEPPAEPDWEVKRVEGMEVYEVEGLGLVRYFKIRWEGDWPPEQNPSWEPESNLPSKLIKNYMKNSKRRRLGVKPPAPKKAPAKEPVVAPSYAPRKKAMKQTTLSWGLPAKQYKSVSEAFAGDEEDELGMPMEDIAPNNHEDEEEDELFVVEEPPTKKSRVRTSWGGNGTAVGSDLNMLPDYM